MNIISVNATLVSLPLSKPYTIAYKTITDTALVFLEIVLENGVTGMGSANPFAEVVGETPAVTLANLQTGFVHDLIGRDIRHFEQIIQEAATHFPALPGTLAAIDIALHDAFGKYRNIPVVDIYGRQCRALPTSVTIGIKESAQMVEEAKAIYAAGFRIVKIKTGMDVEADAARVARIAEQFGKSLTIRVDANQGYTLPQLKQFIRLCAKLPIELIEQPLPRGKENELRNLPIETRKMLVADESLTGIESAAQWAVAPQPFGVFNIKLMKCGGIKMARDIAGIAARAGIDLFWGCNDESLVSITAALHAALSCSNTRYLDLDGSFDVLETLVAGGFTVKDGLMYPSELPGLGIIKTDAGIVAGIRSAG